MAKKKLTHRDIKPLNIIYDQATDQYSLIDFGLSKFSEIGLHSSSSSDGHRWATPGWSAPEFWSEGASGNTTDVYSLGVLMYYMLTLDEKDPKTYSSDSKNKSLSLERQKRMREIGVEEWAIELMADATHWELKEREKNCGSVRKFKGRLNEGGV